MGRSSKTPYDFAAIPLDNDQYLLLHRGASMHAEPTRIGIPTEYWQSTVEGSLTDPNVRDADSTVPAALTENGNVITIDEYHTLCYMDEYCNINPVPIEPGDEHDTWEQHSVPTPITALMVRPELIPAIRDESPSDEDVLDQIEGLLLINGTAVQYGSYRTPFHSDHYTDIEIHDDDGQPVARYRFSNEPCRVEEGRVEQAAERIEAVARDHDLIQTDRAAIVQHM